MRCPWSLRPEGLKLEVPTHEVDTPSMLTPVLHKAKAWLCGIGMMRYAHYIELPVLQCPRSFTCITPIQ